MRARSLFLSAALILGSALVASPALAAGAGECPHHGECCESADCCDDHGALNKISERDEAEVHLAVKTMLDLKEVDASKKLTASDRKQIDSDIQGIKTRVRERRAQEEADVAAKAKSAGQLANLAASQKHCKKKCCAKHLTASVNAFDGAGRTLEGACKHGKH